MWATVPVNLLFAEEKQCRRCGATLDEDRRVEDRRFWVRRQMSKGLPETGERRLRDRRVAQRRRSAA
jgi:hypothetical protein